MPDSGTSLRQVNEEVAHLSQLVSDLDELARAEARELTMAIADVGVGMCAGHRCAWPISRVTPGLSMNWTTRFGRVVTRCAHVFDRFCRADPSRQRATGGSGLGLTIAKHLAEAQGGRVWADSDAAGVTVGVALPIA